MKMKLKMDKIQLLILVAFTQLVTLSSAQQTAIPPQVDMAEPPQPIGPPPQFQPNNYSFSVIDNVAAGSVLLAGINVTSTGWTGQLLQLTCSAQFDSNPTSCNMFSLIALSQDHMHWAGNLVLGNSQLNYNQKSSYLLTLAAYDGNSTVYQNVTITVMSSQSLPPTFTGATSASIAEITDNSLNLIIQYTAVDGNIGTTPRAIQYRLDSGTNYFRIEQLTGRLYNTGPLTYNDPNWAQGYMTIAVEAADVIAPNVVGFGNLTTSTTILSTISIFQTVDHPPVFGFSSYTGSVYEHSSYNTAVQGINLVVADQDKAPINSTFSLRLDNYANIFAVSPNNATGSVTASIVVINSGALDYNIGPQSYSFNVIAYETLSVLHLSSSASVVVNLTPNNDYPPVFTRSVYNASVNETAPGGTSVVQVLATERNVGLYGNASIRYKFGAGSIGSFLFRCDVLSGLITVGPCSTPGSGSCINYDVVQQYSLLTLAVNNYGEGFTASAMVNIAIIDDNNNPPVFPVSTYLANINEGDTIPTLVGGSNSGQPLQVVATEKDSSTNGNNNITYSIAGGNDNQLWVLSPSAGTIIAVRPVSYSDTPGDQGYFLLTVVATDPDPSHKAVVTVNISVIAQNLYPPVFDQGGNYSVSIIETALPGTVVETIHATDKDSPATPGGQVRYRLGSGGQDKFQVNYTTGVVTVAPGATFDYTVQNQYSITIIAEDLGTPQQITNGILVVNINPNRPEPKFSSSTIKPPGVQESSPLGYDVTTLFANNTNPNRSIVYSFIEPIVGYDPTNQPVSLSPTDQKMFVVNPQTGVVTVNEPLSYNHVATWQAVIMADDTNAVNETGTATIIITILPVNDKPPVFTLPWTTQTPYYNKTVDENQAVGSYLFTIDATSPNSSLTVTYEMVDSDSGTFSVTNQTGQIFVNKVLNYEQDSNVMFVVAAVDNGVPSLTSTATFYVQLQNMNDHAPQFTQTQYNATIQDDSPAGTTVTTVIATDVDTGDFGVVRYTLIDNSRFLINNITGVITVAPGATFNGDLEPVIVLSVEAYDSPNEPLYRKFNYTSVNITIIAINRYPPVFSQPTYNISVLETNPINRTIISVLAYLPSGITVPITYRIVKRNDPNLFAINPLTGEIYAPSSLVGFSNTYNLTVMAVDFGQPPLNSTSLVVITVLSSAHNIPIFSFPPVDEKTFYVNETSPANTVVTTVVATVINNGVQGAISYYINGLTLLLITNNFKINMTTGVITTARQLPYSSSPYVLNIIAQDYLQAQALRIINVQVLLVHTQDPYFTHYPNTCCSMPITLIIDKNAPIGSIVGTVEARLDNPIHFINYSLVSNDSGSFFSLREGMDLRTAQIFVNNLLNNQTIVLPHIYHLRVQAFDMNYPDGLLPSSCMCTNGTNDTMVDINIVVENLIVNPPPNFDNQYLSTCVADNAGIGSSVYQFNNSNYDPRNMAHYLPVSLQNMTGTTAHPTNMNFLAVFNLTDGGILSTTTAMTSYEQQYFFVTVSSTFDNSANQDVQLTVYVTPYTQEILVTVNKPPAVVKTGINNITNAISNYTNGGIVCIVLIQYHVTDEGVVDPSTTDIYMYVINGSSKTIVSPATLNSVFILNARELTGVIGITSAYSYWAGFIYNPVAAAIGIIIGLLVLALILFFCCCFFWSYLLSCCRRRRVKEPLIYNAGSLGVVNPVWSPKLAQEEQVLTMPVPEGEGMDRTIALHGEYNQGIDTGDGDVFGTNLGNGAAGLQNIGGGGSQLSGYVHIEAPLTASRSASAYGTVSGYGQSHNDFVDGGTTGAANMTTYEEERMSTHTSNIGTSMNNRDGADGSRASYSTSGAMKFTRGTMAESPEPQRSQSTGTMVGSSALPSEHPVRLNNPNHSDQSKIGATLFRPGGQGYAQSVISGTSYVPDRYNDGPDYGFESTAGMAEPYRSNDARHALPLNTEVIYNDLRPESYYDDGDVMPRRHPSDVGDVYQGEVHLRPMNARHSSASSDHIQETRFM